MMNIAEKRKQIKEYVGRMDSKYEFTFHRTKKEEELGFGQEKGTELILINFPDEKKALIPIYHVDRKTSVYINNIIIKLASLNSLFLYFGKNNKNISYDYRGPLERTNTVNNSEKLNWVLEGFKEKLEANFWPFYQSMNTLADYYQYYKYEFPQIVLETNISNIMFFKLLAKICEPKDVIIADMWLEKEISWTKENRDDAEEIFSNWYTPYLEAVENASRESLIEQGILSKADFVLTSSKETYRDLFLKRYQDGSQYDSMREYLEAYEEFNSKYPEFYV